MSIATRSLTTRGPVGPCRWWTPTGRRLGARAIRCLPSAGTSRWGATTVGMGRSVRGSEVRRCARARACQRPASMHLPVPPHDTRRRRGTSRMHRLAVDGCTAGAAAMRRTPSGSSASIPGRTAIFGLLGLPLPTRMCRLRGRGYSPRSGLSPRHRALRAAPARSRDDLRADPDAGSAAARRPRQGSPDAWGTRIGPWSDRARGGSRRTTRARPRHPAPGPAGA